MPTSTTTLTVNYGAPVTLSGTMANGIGSATVDLNTGTYHIDATGKSIILNVATVSNYDSNSVAKSRTIMFAKDAYKLLFGECVTRGTSLTNSTALSDIFGPISLSFADPIIIMPDRRGKYYSALNSDDIYSLFNFGDGISKTKFGFELSYADSVGAQKAYLTYSSHLLGRWARTEIPRRSTYSLINAPDTIRLEVDGDSARGYTSEQLRIEPGTIYELFGVAFSDMVESTTITIKPILYIGDITGTLGSDLFVSYIQEAGGVSAISAQLTKPAAVNPNIINIANADSTNNEDKYDDSFGWIGTYNRSAATDSSIVITTEGA